jgi:hypothetical protein
MLDELLAGSPVLPEARQRKSALQQQWQTLQDAAFASDPEKFPPGVCVSGIGGGRTTICIARIGRHSPTHRTGAAL